MGIFRPGIPYERTAAPKGLRAMRVLLTASTLVAGWLLLAPPLLGGKTSYALIQGSSMLPVLGAGDLAVVRARSLYDVGDAVAYRSADLGRIVLHRIVAIRDGDLTLRGDSNPYDDPQPVARSAIVGELWFRIPTAGTVIAWLKQPWHAAIVAAIGVFLAGFGRRKRLATGAITPAAAGAAWLVAAGVSGWSLATPAVREVTDVERYRHRASFDYTGRVTHPGIDQSGRIEPGEPVFLRASRRVVARVAYSLVAPDAAVRGTAALDLVVSDPNGWQRTIRLADEVPFSGPAASIEGVLDLDRLERTVRRLERGTGFHTDSYRVALVPRVRVTGTVGGRQVDDAFEPSLAFRLDDVALQLDRSESETPSLSVERPVSSTTTAPAMLPGPVPLSVRDGRILFLGLLAVVSAVGVAVLRARNVGGHARLVAHVGDRLVAASVWDQAADPKAIRITSTDDLLRIAALADCPVLHERRGGVHTYVVDSGNARYWLREGNAPREDGHAGNTPEEDAPPTDAPAMNAAAENNARSVPSWIEPSGSTWPPIPPTLPEAPAGRR